MMDQTLSKSATVEQLDAEAGSSATTCYPLPVEPVYGVIYADPPWQYENGGSQGGVDAEYGTMTDDDLMAMKIPAAKDCVLYMWATSPRLDAAIKLIDAWGFTYKTGAVWDKERLGIGYWFRGQHELLLVGTKGKVSPPPSDLRIRSVIRSRSSVHSRKPDYVRDKIAEWFPDVPRLEMFARIKREGWDAFGNQVEHDLFSDNTKEQLRSASIVSDCSDGRLRNR